MRHAVERARQAARVVPALPGRAVGTLGRTQPAPDPRWSRPARQHRSGAPRRRSPHVCHAGYRWIAVRPGAAPAQRRRRRRVGPDPALRDHPALGSRRLHGFGAARRSRRFRAGPSAGLVRFALTVAAIVFGRRGRSCMLVRYVLLVINRNTLLHPVVAGAALWLGVVASVVGVRAAVIGCCDRAHPVADRASRRRLRASSAR